MPIPDGLCLTHREMCRKWLCNDYNPRRPSEWPGGQLIMDNRTTHAQRRADWEKKNREQVDLVAEMCRSGRSRQCGET